MHKINIRKQFQYQIHAFVTIFAWSEKNEISISKFEHVFEHKISKLALKAKCVVYEFFLVQIAINLEVA